jgi:serine/threonine protein kinase
MMDPDPNATGVKIADFGLSRFCRTGSGQPLATMCGSPAYVAPEILSVSQSKQVRACWPDALMCIGSFWQWHGLPCLMQWAVSGLHCRAMTFNSVR